jgi:hypothetical protein
MGEAKRWIPSWSRPSSGVDHGLSFCACRNTSVDLQLCSATAPVLARPRIKCTHDTAMRLARLAGLTLICCLSPSPTLLFFLIAFEGGIKMLSLVSGQLPLCRQAGRQA